MRLPSSFLHLGTILIGRGVADRGSRPLDHAKCDFLESCETAILGCFKFQCLKFQVHFVATQGTSARLDCARSRKFAPATDKRTPVRAHLDEAGMTVEKSSSYLAMMLPAEVRSNCRFKCLPSYVTELNMWCAGLRA